MPYDHKKEQKIKRQISKLKAQARALEAELTKPLNLNPTTFEDMKGKHYHRRNGTVVYEIDKLKADNSYRPYYNFTSWSVKLRRVDGKGNKWLMVPEFEYDFVEVE